MKMEQNKTEQHFKAQLEAREIQPSAAAWDRLDAMLSITEEKKKPKKKMWWLPVAACLGFLLTGGILFTLEEKNTNDSIIKDMPVVTVPAFEKITPHSKTVTGTISKIDTAVTTATPITKQNTTAVAIAEKINYNQKSSSNHNQKTNSKIAGSSTAPAFTAPVTQQPAVTRELKTVNIDAQQLLASVESTITNETPEQTKTTKTKIVDVNASSLLSSVENELDDNFRDKAIRTAVKGFNKVKTAVVTRNYE